MPTYEYACADCGRRLEVFQSFTEEPLVECEVCGGTLRRVFHPVGILFKGSGFYSTDARAKSSSKASNGATKDSDPKKSASSNEGSSGSSKEGGSADGGAKPKTEKGGSSEVTTA